MKNPGDFSNFGLAEGGDDSLTTWMHARLNIAVWPAPATMDVPLAFVERAVIRLWAPPINLSENPSPAPGCVPLALRWRRRLERGSLDP